MFEVTLQPAAIEDIEQAVTWYAEQSQDLGERFLLAVHGGLAALEKPPPARSGHFIRDTYPHMQQPEAEG